MSTLENPSKQLQFTLDALDDFASGRFDVFESKLTEDFTRVLLPTSLQGIGLAAPEPDSKAVFLEKAKFAVTVIFKDGVKIAVKDVCEQPGRVTLFVVETAPSTGPTPDKPFTLDICMMVDIRTESDGTLKLSRVKEIMDSLAMAELGKAMAGNGASGAS